ncbi:hypothetical protein PQX77_015533, partial [Marasmius sp. AFHP31]
LNTTKDTFKANKDEGTVIAKPAIFKGNADNVARFIPMFMDWALEQKALRIKEGAGVTPENVWKLDHRTTIQSALSFCKGRKAGCWAANYLKQANTSMTDASIHAANEKVDAIRELEQMKQAKTGLSDADLMICFQGELNPEVKKLLVTMDLAQGDPMDLDDLEDCSCKAERALEAEGFSTRKRTETTTTAISTTSTTQTTPVGGNGKTCKVFMGAICNHCYGCGEADHIKAQGNHNQEQCHHCKCLGHCTFVCQDKFLGCMPGLGLRPMRVVRINSVFPFTLFLRETVNIGASPPAPTATIASIVPPAPVSALYTPSSDVVAQIVTLQDSLNQQNMGATALFHGKSFVSTYQAGGIIHFAQLRLTVDSTETWTDFLKTNPHVDWEKGQVLVTRKVTIKEVEDKEWWAGTGNPPLSDSIFKSIHASVIEEPLTDSMDSLPLYHVRANRMTQRALIKKGILEDCHDSLWIAAWYTYSQEMEGEASKGKPEQMYEEMVPPEY